MCNVHAGMLDSYFLGIIKNVSCIRLAQSPTTLNITLLFTLNVIELFITYSYVWYGCFHCVFNG